MIQSIDLPKLRNAEYLQFQKDIVAIVERNNPTTLKVTTKLNDLKTKTTELDILFKKILASENTQILVDLDARRDNAINGISYIALGYTYHFDATFKIAGQKITDNLAIYGGGIARLNYQAETATITNIITDWETKPDLIAALTKLNLTAWKNELKLANTEFSTKYLDRTQEYGNATPENLKTKREETNTVYYALRDRINASHILVETPTSPYQAVINQLNAVLEQYNTLLKNRATEVVVEIPPTN